MPLKTVHKEMLETLGSMLVSLVKTQNQHLVDNDFTDVDMDMDIDQYVLTNSEGSLNTITTPSSNSKWTDTLTDDDEVDQADFLKQIAHLHCSVEVLMDKIQLAWVLERLAEAALHAPQLHILAHNAIHQPHHFQQKVCILPIIFDDILDRISSNPIFHNCAYIQQLSISIQLMIFLKCIGHYGNANGAEDLREWAGVSMGTMANCTQCVMIALLDDCHNDFIYFLEENSHAMQKACQFAESRSCCSWHNGVFAVDGSTFNLFMKPSLYGEMFYDRKSRYLLNCQVSISDFAR